MCVCVCVCAHIYLLYMCVCVCVCVYAYMGNTYKHLHNAAAVRHHLRPYIYILYKHVPLETIHLQKLPYIYKHLHDADAVRHHLPVNFNHRQHPGGVLLHEPFFPANSQTSECQYVLQCIKALYRGLLGMYSKKKMNQSGLSPYERMFMCSIR